jgi:hypothetical protein
MAVIAGDELLSPDDLRRQGEEDYRGEGRFFFPVRFRYGSPEWAAWYDGVIAAKDAEKENQHERTA